MAVPLPEALAQVRSAVLDDATLVRAVGSGRRRGSEPPWRRVELRYVDLKAGRRLQVTTYDQRQAHTRNLEPGADAEAGLEDLLAQPFGNWHVDTVGATVQVRVTKKGDALVHRKALVTATDPERGHDRAKQRMLDPGDPVLHVIGIADHQGRIKPSRQAKYRQIEAFVRSLDEALDSAQRAGALPEVSEQLPLRVVDLGCGNAYLTFAAYAYLTDVRRLPTRMVGIDVQPGSVERNNEHAQELGWDELTFVAGTIEDTEVATDPDVVLALHACDTATDDALARGVGWNAPVILAAPCCHHDLQTQLKSAATPTPYSLMMQHGILRERFADVLTDTFRAALLREQGYRVEVIAFVESQHTPRNTLLRAIRTTDRGSPASRSEYDELVDAWGVHPALAQRLSPH